MTEGRPHPAGVSNSRWPVGCGTAPTLLPRATASATARDPRLRQLERTRARLQRRGRPTPHVRRRRYWAEEGKVSTHQAGDSESQLEHAPIRSRHMDWPTSSPHCWHRLQSNSYSPRALRVVERRTLLLQSRYPAFQQPHLPPDHRHAAQTAQVGIESTCEDYAGQLMQDDLGHLLVEESEKRILFVRGELGKDHRRAWEVRTIRRE